MFEAGTSHPAADSVYLCLNCLILWTSPLSHARDLQGAYRRPIDVKNGHEPPDLRETVAYQGAETLTDAELICVLLRRGPTSPGALRFSRALLDSAGGIHGLRDLSYSELLSIKGVGHAGAATLLANLELGRRLLSGAAPGVRLGSSHEASGVFRPFFAGEPVEVFSCALVDSKLRLIKTETISRGTLTGSMVHPRDAFRPAVRNAASAVIFAHNHPSGDPLPSEEDRRITGRLEEAGRILGIPVLDHVVLGTNGSYYSFADSGLLEGSDECYRGSLLR